MAASDGYRYIVAVGGDGTVNEVANGILRSSSPTETSLGVVSTGTGSDFAHSAGIPRDYTRACSLLVSSRRRLIDVGVVEFKSKGLTLQHFFLNVAGVGFDAAVVEATEKVPKYFGGTIPYLGGLFRSLFSYQNKLVILSVGDRVETKRILDVVVIGDVGKFELLKALPMVYKGTHINHPKVTAEQATRISIESSERVLVYADGELLGECPSSFRLMPAALSIVV